jgi:guanylate kinase
MKKGKFICCNEYNGDWYGIQWESIESVARQGLACVTQMELESLLSFKQYYFEPRCVLIITLDKDVQSQRLMQQGCREKECDLALARSDWYSEYNQSHPGFFDSVIISGTTIFASQRNKKLVYIINFYEQLR